MQKDGWDKFKIIAVLILPIVIGVCGYFINSTLKQREIKVRYVEIAVNILREKPRQETNALRDWAVDVLSSYSPIPLRADAINELKQNPLPGHAFLTDERGNFITDENGNRIEIETQPQASPKPK
jgi:hypothetical protein